MSLVFLQKLQGFLWNTHTLEALYKIALQLESNQSPWMHEPISTTNMYFCISFEDCPNSIIMRKKIANDFEEKLNPHSLQYHRYWPNAKIYTTN